MHLKYDPIEDTEEYKLIEYELELKLAPYIEQYKAESQKAFEEVGVYPGIAHRVYEKKKQILLQDYNIKWKTPVEMNPGVNID